MIRATFTESVFNINKAVISTISWKDEFDIFNQIKDIIDNIIKNQRREVNIMIPFRLEYVIEACSSLNQNSANHQDVKKVVRLNALERKGRETLIKSFLNNLGWRMSASALIKWIER